MRLFHFIKFITRIFDGTVGAVTERSTVVLRIGGSISPRTNIRMTYISFSRVRLFVRIRLNLCKRTHDT